MRYTFKVWLSALLLTIAVAYAHAQAPNIDPTSQIQWNLWTGASTPTAACTQNGQYATFPYGAQWGQWYLDQGTDTWYGCGPSGWVAIGSGGGGLPAGWTVGGTPPTGATQVVTAPGELTARQLGPTYQADQFPGSDVGAKINACFAAVEAAGGGTCDASNLVGSIPTNVNCASTPALCVESGEIDGNTRALGDGSPGVAVQLILPPQGTIVQNFVGGPVTYANTYVGNGSAANLSGYPNGCTLNLTEPAGFPYSNTGATGAMITVINSSGSNITGYTVTTPSTGYLTTGYLVPTNGTCTGSGLVINVTAADMLLRANARFTLKTGAQGGGADNMTLLPYSGLSGVVGQALLGTDQASGYVRTEAIKATNYGTGASYTAALGYFEGLLDASKIGQFESSGPGDVNIRINACCTAEFDQPHADGGDASPWPVIVGAAGIINNVCITNGSTAIHAPYAHWTAYDLGDVLLLGSATETTLWSGTATIVGVTDFNDITISTPITGATNSTNPVCTTAALTGGTGLTLQENTPSTINVVAVSINGLVSNSPGAGFQNMLVTEGVVATNFNGGYMESNQTSPALDNYTPQVSISYSGVGIVNFFGTSFQASAAGKYAIQSGSKGCWNAWGITTNTGINDTYKNAVIPSSLAANYNPCGLPWASNGSNLLGDTEGTQGTAYWTLGAGVTWAPGGQASEPALAYTAPTTSAGDIYSSQYVTGLVVGQTYTVGGWINVAAANGGGTTIRMCSTSSCAVTWISATVANGSSLPVSIQFTAATTTAYYVVKFSGMTSAGGTGVVSVSQPWLVGGSAVGYAQNSGPPASTASTGSKFASVTINGAAGGSYVKADGTGSGTPSGAGTVTTSGTPTTGTLAAFSGSTVIANATAAELASLLSGLTGCATLTYLYSPASSDCTAPGGGSMVYPGAGIANSTGSAWGTSLAAPVGTIVGTTDTQTLTNKTLDGVTPTTMGYVDPTSSIQTQLNSKQASGTYVTPSGSPVNPNAACFSSSTAITACTSANLQTAIGGTVYDAYGAASAITLAGLGGAPLASPTFTGTPAAPTPGSNISTTQLPTTAWVNTYFTPTSGLTSWFATYIATLSGCTTATYLYSPASANCTAPGGSSAWSGITAGTNTQTSAFSSTAPWTFSAAGALSTSSMLFSGTLLTSGGTGTTTFPLVSIWPSGAAAPTSWSTAGTMLGIAAPSGFLGNLIDTYVNAGTSVFSVSRQGIVTSIANFSTSLSGGFRFTSAANSGLYSSASGVDELGSTDTVAGAVAKLILGGVQSGGTTFTASGCSNGTLVGGASAGKMTLGANTCSVTVTMGNTLTATNGWSCRANDETTAAGNTGLYFSGSNTTTATLVVPATAGSTDVIDFSCMAF